LLARPEFHDRSATNGGPVSVYLTLIFGRPKSHYGTGRNSLTLKAGAPTWVTTKPDIDKCQRSIFDALTDAGVWRDDSQVARVTVLKRYVEDDETPGAIIEVETLV
jgi:Holliday junction resolvase RusA-like endonuclease